MVRSVVVGFDGRGLVLGNATARMSGMQVRVLIHGVKEERLETTLELAQAGPTTQVIVHGLATRYDSEIMPLQNGSGAWTGRVVYRRPDQLRGHPVYDALLEFVPRMDGGALFFEAGIGILRMDSKGTIRGDDVEAALHTWAPEVLFCVEEHDDLPELARWRPGKECVSMRQKVAAAAM